MLSGQHKNKISDIETDDSYWGFGRYCVQGDLGVWSQTRHSLWRHQFQWRHIRNNPLCVL